MFLPHVRVRVAMPFAPLLLQLGDWRRSWANQCVM